MTQLIMRSNSTNGGMQEVRRDGDLSGVLMKETILGLVRVNGEIAMS